MPHVARIVGLGLVAALASPVFAEELPQRNGPLLTADKLFAPDHVVDVRIDLEPDQWDEIRKQSRLLADSLGQTLPESPFTYAKGNITIDGVLIEDVGIRKKGFLGSLSSERPSLKIKFSEFKSQSPVSGISRLTLNNNKQDPSRLSQYLSYKVFNEAGTISPRCNYAKVTINGKYLGIYSNVESIKRPFLNRFGDDSGALYEGTVTDFTPDLVHKFELKNKRAKRVDIQRVVSVLEQEELDLDELEQYLDIDAFIKFWAVESLIGFWDGYTNGQNNFFLYKSPQNAKLYFIPWGTDSAFTSTMPIPPYFITNKSVHSQSVLTNRLYRIPEIQDRYHAAMRNLLSSHWNEEQLLDEIDRVEEMLKGDIHTSNRGFARAVGKVKYFVKTRRSAFESEMNNWPLDVKKGPRRPPSFEPIGTADVTFKTQWYDKTPRSPDSPGRSQYGFDA